MDDRRIRVLHLISTAHAGGIETFVLELARHIDRRRFDLSVCILGSHGPLVEALRATGAAVYILGVRKSFWRSALSYFFYVQTGRFDVVHANVGGRLARYLARLARCRVVITHIHGHGDEEMEAWRQGDLAYGPRIERTYVRGAHRLVACSHSIASMLTACFPPIANRISVVPHGVNLDRFQPVSPDSAPVKALRHELGLSEGDPVVGFIGRLVPQKGLTYLLAAAEVLQIRYPNIRFVIVGDGPLGKEMKAATVSFGNNRCLFLGERSDVPSLLALFDVLAVPSDWEPFGIVNLEAMAAAKPVVAFDVDGIPEAIVHGKTGLLVPHRDSRALASAIAQLLDDAPLRRRMGAAGRRRVEQSFDVRDMTQAFESLYETATGRRDEVQSTANSA
jgi:glycosyltransferase involved in cell wall biosynthesis